MTEARITLSADDKSGAAFASLNQRLAGLAQAADSISTRFTAVAAGFGTALLAKNYFDGIAEGLDKLNDLKDATGASIGNISALEDVAKRTGANFETVAASLTKLNKGLQNAKPGDDVSNVLAAIGLEAGKLKALDPAAALLEVAKGLDQFANDGNKARATQVLFGKSLQEVAPFLKDLAEVGQLNATVTDEQAAAAERYANRLAASRKSFEDLGRTVVSAVLPVIEEVQRAFDGAGDSASRFSAIGEAFRTVFEAIVVLGANVAYTFKQIGRNLGALSAQYDALRRLDFKGFRAISDAVSEDNARAAKELDEFEKRVLRVVDNARGAGAGRGFVNPPGVSAPSLQVASGGTVKQQVSDYDKYIDRLLESLRATQGLSVAEQARADIALGKLGKLTDAQAAYAVELANVIDLSKQPAAFVGPELAADILEQRKKDAAEIKRLIDASQASQFDSLLAITSRVNEAFAQGSLTAEQYRRAMESIGKQTDALVPKLGAALETASTFADQAARNIQDALGDSLLASMSDKFDSIAKIWGDMLKRMVAQAAAADLARSLLGDSFAKTGQIGGGLGALFSLLGGGSGGAGFEFIGGARAAGGPVQAGRAYLVGERGPEIMVPQSSGTVLPNGVAAGNTYQVIVQGDASANTLRLIQNALAQFEARRLRGAYA